MDDMDPIIINFIMIGNHESGHHVSIIMDQDIMDTSSLKWHHKNKNKIRIYFVYLKLYNIY